MIVGEDQILGQIKDSRKRSIKEKCCGRVLNTVFTKAIHVGQSVRKKTRINEGSVSIGSTAVDLAEKVHEDDRSFIRYLGVIWMCLYYLEGIIW